MPGPWALPRHGSSLARVRKGSGRVQGALPGESGRRPRRTRVPHQAFVEHQLYTKHSETKALTSWYRKQAQGKIMVRDAQEPVEEVREGFLEEVTPELSPDSARAEQNLIISPLPPPEATLSEWMSE